MNSRRSISPTRTRPVFEKCHPVQILEITQTAAAILDVRLLHRRRVSEISRDAPPGSLIRAAMYRLS